MTTKLIAALVAACGIGFTGTYMASSGDCAGGCPISKLVGGCVSSGSCISECLSGPQSCGNLDVCGEGQAISAKKRCCSAGPGCESGVKPDCCFPGSPCCEGADCCLKKDQSATAKKSECCSGDPDCPGGCNEQEAKPAVAKKTGCCAKGACCESATKPIDCAPGAGCNCACCEKPAEKK